jgi:hypothetical protein
MLKYLDYLSTKYPQVVEMITIGKSSLGQPLKVVKVSTGQRTKKGEIKPAVWIDGGELIHHHTVTLIASLSACLNH